MKKKKRIKKRFFVRWKEDGQLREEECSNPGKAKLFKINLLRKGIKRVNIETRNTKVKE